MDESVMKEMILLLNPEEKGRVREKKKWQAWMSCRNFEQKEQCVQVPCGKRQDASEHLKGIPSDQNTAHVGAALCSRRKERVHQGIWSILKAIKI